MGEAIVHELGLANSNDTLGRWMAHRIAELMQRADAASDDAVRELTRKEASDLILRLWSHRSSWPRGWPPKASAAIETVSRRHSEQATGSPWLDTLDELRILQSRERQIWTRLGLLDFDIESERRLVGELDGEGADEERRPIEAVIRLWELAEKEMCESIGSAAESRSARAQAGIIEMADVDSARDELRSRVVSEAQQGSSSQ